MKTKEPRTLTNKPTNFRVVRVTRSSAYNDRITRAMFTQGFQIYL